MGRNIKDITQEEMETALKTLVEMLITEKMNNRYRKIYKIASDYMKAAQTFLNDKNSSNGPVTNTYHVDGDYNNHVSPPKSEFNPILNNVTGKDV